MAGLVYELDYVIILSDPVFVAALQAQFPNGLFASPIAAAAVFGASVLGRPNGPGGTIVLPIIPTTWHAQFNLGTSGLFTADPSVSQGTIPAYTDAAGDQWPASSYFWNGTFVLQGPSVPASPVPPPIGVRRFAIGFETPLQGEFAITGNKPSRASSRTLDGYGYAYRTTAINDGGQVTMPSNIQNSYERLYVRLQKLPTGLDMLWGAQGSSDIHPSVHVSVTSTGALSIYNRGNNSFPGTLLGTSGPLALNTWYRLDLHFGFAPSVGSQSGFAAMFLNGAQIVNAGVSRGSLGLGTPQTHATSDLGNIDGPTPTNGLEADIDDWINSDFININIGSHCQLVRATGFAPAHNPAWIGDWRALLAQVADSSLAANAVSTSTASAQMEVTTDFQQTTPPQVASVSISIFDRGISGAGNGQLGYRGPGGPVLQTVALGAATYSRALITAPGTAYIALGSFNLIFIKDPSGTAYGASSLMASVELAGTFGQEDVAAGSAVTVPSATRNGIHNGPYPSLTDAALTLMMPSIAYGTYVGNGFGQDVLTNIPTNWFFVRAVGGNADGVWWWSSMDTAHGYVDELMTPDRMFRAQLSDQTNNLSGVMRLAGQDVQANSNGVTYQWVAVSDPAQRFITNGAFRHPTSLASVLNALVNPTFTPEAAFFFVEAPSTSGGGNSFFKGVGHTATSASPLDGAVNATVAALSAGAVTSKAAIHNAQGTQPQTAFSAWRRSDGSGTILFDLQTWVGDGTGAKNIAVNLGVNTVPRFAIVTPHNGASYFRDPSHTGTQSSEIGVGTVANNGIIGFAANQVQVGTTLNALGVTYDLFVLPGPGFFGPPGVPGVVPPPSVIPQPPPTPTTPPSRGACYPLTQAIADLGARLGDPGNVHWTAAELTRYIAEALRVYNAFTMNYRNRASFNATVFQAFYDLPTVIPTLRAYNLADRDLVTDIEYSLMEPPTPTVWTGTKQFDLTTVAACLQKRRDQFLKETGIVLTREIVSLTAPASGRVPLPIDVLTLRRLAWVTPANVVSPLKRDDEWSLAKYAQAWRSVPVDPAKTYPTVYSSGVEPPLTAQLAPVPLSAGFFDLLAIVLGNVFTPATTASLVGVPDDWAWVVKFGALADLLSQDGLAKDPQRAAYCEARWQQGIATAIRASVVLNAEISGSPVQLYAVNDADSYLRAWQTTPGTPTKVLTAGHNVAALASPPDLNNGGPPYVVTLDVVANMPVPVAGTDCLNVGLDLAELDTIYDYVEHLALFKEGPGQLNEAMALYQRFTRACGVTVSLDYASTPDRAAIMGQTTQDTKVHPRDLPSTEPPV